MLTEDQARKQLETLHQEGRALAKAFADEEEDESFGDGYQRWYSRALPLMKQLALDRYAEFQSYYAPDPRYPWGDTGAYVIQDYFRGRDFVDPDFDPKPDTARCFRIQLAILKSVSDCLSWGQMDTADQAERGLQLAFLETARNLMSIDARSAGAMAATVRVQTDEVDDVEYDAAGRLHKIVEDGPEKYVETRVLSYQQDPTAGDYGRLDSVVVTRAAKADAQPDYLRNVRIGYDPEGYFETSYTSLGLDPQSSVVEPITGRVLSETKDGVTETFRYDILGRAVHYERTEKGKDKVVWDADYERCTPRMCRDAAYYVIETINGRRTALTYYKRNGQKMNHPADSLIKDND